jgi:hypothetical protein
MVDFSRRMTGRGAANACARSFAGASAVACLVVGSPGSTFAEAPSRRPLPEALLTESATDIDAEVAGELELEANVLRAAARRGGTSVSLASLELEWRVLREVGVRLEPSYTQIGGSRSAPARSALGMSGALALGLLHDRALEAHLQAEFVARSPESENANAFEPGEPQLPIAADLVGALRRGRWTLRATAGAEAGGSFAHAPVHTDIALLTSIAPDTSFGFVGVEARADWARVAPLVLALEIVADTARLDVPVRVGVALPFNVGAESSRPSYGLFVRVQWLIGGED